MHVKDAENVSQWSELIADLPTGLWMYDVKSHKLYGISDIWLANNPSVTVLFPRLTILSTLKIFTLSLSDMFFDKFLY